MHINIPIMLVGGFKSAFYIFYLCKNQSISKIKIISLPILEKKNNEKKKNS